MTTFQRSRRLRIAACFAFGFIVLVLASIANAQIFALQPGDEEALRPLGQRGSTRITQQQLKLVDGLTIRTRKWWPDTFLESCVATVHTMGKKWTWLPCGGDEANPLSATNMAAREKLYRDKGTQYANDPSLYAVHACVPPYKHSEECFYGKKMPAAAREAQKRIISVAAVAFPTQRIIWAGSPEDPAANLEIIRYGNKVAPGRFVYKMNAMSPKDNWGWAGTRLLIDAAKLGTDISYEQLQPSNHPNFGGTWPQFVAKVKEVQRRAGKRFVYQALYRLDLPKAGGLK